MNIVYLTTEAVPFAKTGGLADVCGTLPWKVAELGHRAAVIMPAFRSIHSSGIEVETTDVSFAVPMSDRKLVGARLLKSTLPYGDVPVWFIDQPQYFDRDGLYGDRSGDYADNAERFTFFCRAALTAIARIGWAVDVLHCNDWQTGLIPALIKSAPNVFPWVRNAATVMTIHNMAYQGQFPASAFSWTGLDWSYFRHESFEFYGNLNFLKAGLATADQITTVSPRYAQEIQTPQHGCGLDGVLGSGHDHVTGITNGIDPTIWDPANDSKIEHPYDTTDWQSGKTANKVSIQRRFDLKLSREVPLIGLVGRLAEQKGWDLILPVLRWHLEQGRPTQWVVLGSGDPRVEFELSSLAKEFGDQFGLHVGFDEALAHQIEAASDLFLMPSHYEPCGLNQLYSLRYGAVPVVTETGGLADTVVDCNEETLADRTATGFYLHEVSPVGLDDAIGRALQLRYHDPKKWEQIVLTGMNQDWSWRKSACQYVELYDRAVSLKQGLGKV
ncbi:glycogen synthase GlgA [Stieleria varia]|uniref:glycogen synthase GlgA n=1 Tax=Stieleria varia TaxID=2528005 RepID=UPI0011B71AC9|nr:glycogen synthase GlgA [Stieleria varia]